MMLSIDGFDSSASLVCQEQRHGIRHPLQWHKYRWSSYASSYGTLKHTFGCWLVILRIIDNSSTILTKMILY